MDALLFSILVWWYIILLLYLHGSLCSACSDHCASTLEGLLAALQAAASQQVKQGQAEQGHVTHRAAMSQDSSHIQLGGILRVELVASKLAGNGLRVSQRMPGWRSMLFYGLEITPLLRKLNLFGTWKWTCV